LAEALLNSMPCRVPNYILSGDAANVATGRYGVRVGDLEVSWPNRWPDKMWKNVRITQILPSSKSSDPALKVLVTNFEVAVTLGHGLLKQLTTPPPRARPEMYKEVQSALPRLSTLWHLCLSVGVAVSDSKFHAGQLDRTTMHEDALGVFEFLQKLDDDLATAPMELRYRNYAYIPREDVARYNNTAERIAGLINVEYAAHIRRWTKTLAEWNIMLQMRPLDDN
jgi:hypothetical protein